MTDFVVDASVAVKWFIPEIHSLAARRLLNEGNTLHAPDLIWAEVGNVLWKKQRAGELTREIATGIFQDFRHFPLLITASDSLLAVAWTLAYETGKTFYDCLYLALSIGKDCRLVTADLRFHQSLRDSPWGQSILWVEDLP